MTHDFVLPSFIVEYKGHRLLEFCRACDLSSLKKQFFPEVISFKHPSTLDTALVRGLKLFSFLTLLHWDTIVLDWTMLKDWDIWYLQMGFIYIALCGSLVMLKEEADDGVSHPERSKCQWEE